MNTGWTKSFSGASSRSPNLTVLPRDRIKALDQPRKRPGWILEAVDQDRPLSGKTTACKFVAVSHRTAVVGVWRENLLDGRIFKGAVVASQYYSPGLLRAGASFLL